jgi:hypothetical protein
MRRPQLAIRPAMATDRAELLRRLDQLGIAHTTY